MELLLYYYDYYYYYSSFQIWFERWFRLLLRNKYISIVYVCGRKGFVSPRVVLRLHAHSVKFRLLSSLVIYYTYMMYFFSSSDMIDDYTTKTVNTKIHKGQRESWEDFFFEFYKIYCFPLYKYKDVVLSLIIIIIHLFPLRLLAAHDRKKITCVCERDWVKFIKLCIFFSDPDLRKKFRRVGCSLHATFMQSALHTPMDFAKISARKKCWKFWGGLGTWAAFHIGMCRIVGRSELGLTSIHPNVETSK